MNIASRIKENIVWVLARYIFTAVAGVLTTILLIRILSVEDYGIYNLLYGILNYSAIFTSFGIVQVFARYIPEYFQNNQHQTVKRLFKIGLRLRFILVLIFTMVIVLFSECLGGLLNVPVFYKVFLIFSIVIISQALSNLYIVALSSVFLHKYLTVSQVAFSLMRLLGLTFVFFRQCGLFSILIVEAAASLGLLLLLFAFYTRKYFYETADAESSVNFPAKRFLKYGGYNFLNDMGNSILDVSTDFMVLSIYLGPVAVGIYGFSNRVILMFSGCLPSTIFKTLIEPIFYARHSSTGDVKELSRMFSLLVTFNAFMLIPFACGVYVLGDKLIVHVFDQKYVGAFIPLCIIATFSALDSCCTSIGLVLKAVERVDILLKAKLFSIYNLVGDILVVKPYGVIGIALVTGSAVTLQKIFCYYYAYKITKVRIEWKGLIIVLVNSIVMMSGLLLLKNQVNSLMSFILISFLGAFLYFLMSFFNKPFKKSERDFINSLLPKPIFPF